MNIDAAAVPPYETPPLPIPPGATALDFVRGIRQELLRRCSEALYGVMPPRCDSLSFRTVDEGEAFGGLGRRREIDIVCGNRGRQMVIHLLLYLPRRRAGRVPVFLGLNFSGNISVSTDPNVRFFPFRPFPETAFRRQGDSRVTEERRGCHAERNSFEEVLQAGYASATACLEDICFDRMDLAPTGGLTPLFYSAEEWASPRRDFGAIGAWAWGISRIIDCLETQPELDPARVVVHGHSRMGKTALWAAANDQRIAAVAANGSGCCGAKLTRRHYGENLAWVKLWNPHWLRCGFDAFPDAGYPIDQHFVLAAIAPRPVFISGGTEDVYADTVGEFAACAAASPAWRLFGGQGLGDASYPEAGKRVGREIGFYMRAGGHAMTLDVWRELIRFLDGAFGRRGKALP